MAAVRIDQFLAKCGIGSRAEVKRLLKKGLAAVNGIPVTRPEQKVDPAKDSVTMAGKPVCYVPYEYVMLHKPSGCVTAARDAYQRTVMEYLDADHLAGRVPGENTEIFHKADLAPVGRLDLDTEGLLLLTNDGELAHRMLAPKSHVDKTYFARVQGRVTSEEVRAFARGLEIGEKHPTLPAELTVLEEGDISRVELTIHEGKFHQVKRMFASCGRKVLYLKRISMGGVDLDGSLRPGQWRYLTKEEIGQLYDSCGLPRKG